MKRRWFLIGMGIIIAVGIALFLLLTREEEPPSPGVIEELLPADTSFYLTIRDLTSFQQGWHQTSLYQVLEESQLIAQIKLLINLGLFKVESEIGFTADFLPQMFEKGVGLAGVGLPDNGKRIALVFATDLGKRRHEVKRAITEELFPKLKAKFPSFQIEQVTYEGVDYYRLRIRNRGFCCLFIRSLLVVGEEEGALHRIIKVSQGEAASLSREVGWVKLLSQANEATQMLGFVKAEAVRHLDLAPLLALEAKEAEGLRALFNLLGLGCIERVDFISEFRDEGVKDRLFLTLKEKKEGLIGVLVHQRPAGLRTFDLIPPESLFSSIIRTADAPLLWKDFLMEVLVSMVEKGEWFKRLAVADLSSIVGEEAGFSVSLPQPIPLGEDILKSIVFTTYLEVPDPERAERFLSGLFTATPLVVQEEEYKGQPLWLVTSGKRVLFAYTFKQGFLVMTSSQQWLETVLMLEKETVSTSLDFIRVNRYLPTRSVERSYINLPQLLKYLGDLLKQLYPADEEPALIARLIMANLDKIAEEIFGIIRVTIPEEGDLRVELYSPMGMPGILLGGVAGLLPRWGLTYLPASPQG